MCTINTTTTIIIMTTTIIAIATGHQYNELVWSPRRPNTATVAVIMTMLMG